MHKIRPRSINMVTMGCSKNLVDSEILMARFAAGGWKIEFDSDSIDHEVVIINTCGFINDAREESVDVILQYAQAKTEGRIGKLCIVGCLSQVYRDELSAEIPEADLVFGVNAADALDGFFKLENPSGTTTERYLSTPSHYSYLKVSEGCNRRCSFCTIPGIRGRYASRPVDELVREAEMLAGKGTRELILIAQDLTWYGHDLYGRGMLTHLLDKLEGIGGLEWIRLHYAFPVDFPEELLEQISESNKICKYLDIPFQHISDNMLKKMRRGINRERTLRLIDRIRERIPGVALRTTLLTGHPGETEGDFEELMEFVRKTRFDRLGIFAYSHEEKTYAFDNYQDEIPDDEKQRRVAEIMQLQQEISASANKNKIGKIVRVLIDREEADFYYGRTEFDSPDVDNEVIIKKNRSFAPGMFCDVRITGAEEFDLIGEIIPNC